MVSGVPASQVALQVKKGCDWGAQRAKKKLWGIMGACILCDKFLGACKLPNIKKSKETGELNSPTFPKVRPDFHYAEQEISDSALLLLHLA